MAEWPTPTGARPPEILRTGILLQKNHQELRTNCSTLTLLNRAKQWTLECKDAFNTLKHRLTSSPILAFPRFDVEFTVDCDASGEALGAVLSQTCDGREYAISYASRTLTRAECQYCATRHKLQALLWSCRQFRPYLYGRHFTIRTDHNALRWLKNFKELEGQIARWLQILSEYDFQVEHRPGKQHLNADALSRSHCKQFGQSEQPKATENDYPTVLAVSTTEQGTLLPSWNIDNFRQQQPSDSSLQQMINWLGNHSLPSSFPKHVHIEVQALWNQRQFEAN